MKSIHSTLWVGLVVVFLFGNDLGFAGDPKIDIKKPGVPIFGNLVPGVKEGFSLSSGDFKDPFIFSIIYDVVISSADHVVILTDTFLLKLSQTGEIIGDYKIIIGEGPGEFKQRPQKIFIDRLDNLYVSDNYRLVVFSFDFKFNKNINLLVDCNLCIDKEGNFYTFISEHKNGKKFKTLWKIGPDGKRVKAITGFHDSNAVVKGGLSLSVLHDYLPEPYIVVTSDDYLVYNYNLRYEFFKYDGGGKLISSFGLDLEPREIGKAEKNEIASLHKVRYKTNVTFRVDIQFPDHRPFLEDVLIDEKDRIYAIRRGSVLDKSRDEVIDVFSGAGKYLYRLTLPFCPQIIRDGCAYWIEKKLDHNGEEVFIINKSVIEGYNTLQSNCL